MAGSIANAVKVTGNAVTSLTTAGITTTTGNTFVIGVTHASGTTPNTPTDNKGNTYTILGTTQTTGGGTGATLFVCENGTGGASHTITQTFAAAADPSVFFVEVAGVRAASFDTGSRAQVADSASPFTVTSGTLAQADEIVLALIGHGSAANPATLAESTGFTIAIAEENASLFWSGGIAYKVVSATTALTPSFTATGAGDAALHIAGFQASTAGPSITTQPVSRRVPSGQTASFSITATGSGSLTYQWQSNSSGSFANISGETATSYTTGTLPAGAAYAVRCIATDINGSTNSTPADVWTPVTKPAPWAGLYFRNLKRNSVASWTILPNSKTSGPIVDTALWGVVVASGTTGTLAKTNNNDTVSASGTTVLVGTLSRTNNNDTVVASGTTTIRGTLNRTNANDTLAATGSVGASVTGTLSYTNNNDTSNAAGTTTLVGTLSRTNGNDTSTGQGTVVLVGSLSRTNTNDTGAASGTTTITATLSITNNNDTSTGTGSVGSSIFGTLVYTNSNDSLASSGTTTIVGTMNKTNNNDTLSANASSGSGGSGSTTYITLTSAGI